MAADHLPTLHRKDGCLKAPASMARAALFVGGLLHWGVPDRAICKHYGLNRIDFKKVRSIFNSQPLTDQLDACLLVSRFFNTHGKRPIRKDVQ